jgi:hypothetical protein
VELLQEAAQGGVVLLVQRDRMGVLRLSLCRALVLLERAIERGGGA